jgi:hypothetical protein
MTIYKTIEAKKLNKSQNFNHKANEELKNQPFEIHQNK